MEIIVFGTGRYYQNRRSYLQKDNIIAYLDNDANKQGKEIDGVTIWNPKEVSRFSYDYIVLMGKENLQREMKEQLITYGIEAAQILTFTEWQIAHSDGTSLFYYRMECESIFSAEKKVFLITHELSYTGAPIVVFDMAKILRKNGYYPVIICATDGELRKEIVEYGIPVIIEMRVNRKNKFIWDLIMDSEFVVLNTLEVRNLIPEFNDCGKSVIWWLHESDMSYQYVADMGIITDISDNIHIYSAGPLPCEAYIRHTGNTNVKELLYGVNDREQKVIFAIVGSITYRKAQDIFVQAVECLLPEERKKAEFWVIGNCLDNEIMDIVKLKEMQFSEIKVMPPMKRSRWEEVSNNVDVLVCPSRNDPMPVVITEFIRDKKTCIVSDMTGPARYMEDEVNGLICKADDAESLAEKMRWAIMNHSKLRDIGEAARKIYDEKFRMDIFEQNMLKIINNDIT